ncbi:MAG: TlyA family RNA methyltransferase [Vicinamibacteria bacterium]|nr:TlyA family RNA methyltransferase [Vicinamibacteria bacterium]
MSSARRRLDLEIVRRGLAPSRERAQALILAGRVRVALVERPKAGAQVSEQTEIEVDAEEAWVSRGALKLLGALDSFRVSSAERVCLDIGSSTGGFTEVLLSRGAARVYAFDSGLGQLHERLRQDPRVILSERTNARHLKADAIPERPTLATMDVSFISILKILPALKDVLAEGADVVSLVKPQFEAGRAEVGSGGIVRDESVHVKVMLKVAEGASALGFRVLAVCRSRIDGVGGNREFFLHATAPGRGGEGGVTMPGPL